MKKFGIRIFLLAIWIITIVTIGLFLPPTSRAKNSFLFAQPIKDSLLRHTPGPRIIFIGGSNLSFGLDSKIVEDSLRLHPVNTAITIELGLKYMLRQALPYIRENDIVVVCPEYQQYFGHTADGEAEVLSIIFDVSPKTKNLLDARQYFTLLKYVVPYASTKLNPLTRMAPLDTSLVDIYDRKSFDQYGDANAHWKLPKQAVTSYYVEGNFDNDTFKQLIIFRDAMKQKKATLFVTFPCYQDNSFDKSLTQIATVEQQLKTNDFRLLGTPKRYRFPDSLVFNTPYHLTYKGVALRTKLLIGDLKTALR